MKIHIILLFICITISTSYGIEKYSKNDTLYVWADQLNFREAPNIDSKIIGKIIKNSKVTLLEDKFDKSNDISLDSENDNWRNLFTGRWVYVKYNNQKGYVFDVYLSHYSINEVTDFTSFLWKDTIQMIDFESYVRLIKKNGIIQENGIGMEWSTTIYIVPNFSHDEAILLFNQFYGNTLIGKRNWKIDLENDIIEMSESNDETWRKIKTQKFEHFIIMKFSDGV